jgi:hypothetical protein
MVKLLNTKQDALKEMFDTEFRALKDNRQVFGRKPCKVLIAIQFQDGHIHTVLPDIVAASKLSSVISEHISKEVKRLLY